MVGYIILIVNHGHVMVIIYVKGVVSMNINNSQMVGGYKDVAEL